MDEKLLTVAIEAAVKGGKVIKEHFRKNFTVSTKRNFRDLVTSIDLASEKAIVSVIKRHFPQHAILSEESHKALLTSADLWIIDPLDGTVNFIAGLPLFCVSIAYVCHGKIAAGVVYNPLINECYTALRGKGAYLNKTKKLQVSKTNTLLQTFVSFDYSSVTEYRKEIQQMAQQLPVLVRGMRILGSCALEFVWVGTGYLDAYLSRGAHPWDVAAGILIVEEAHGLVTDWQGNPWTLDCQNFIVSNGYVHAALLHKVLKKRWEGTLVFGT